METNHTEETHPMPGKPSAVEYKPRIYKLIYRRFRMAEEMLFEFSGPLKGAIEKGKEYCKQMKFDKAPAFGFVNVSPAFANLDLLMKLEKEGKLDLSDKFRTPFQVMATNELEDNTNGTAS